MKKLISIVLILCFTGWVMADDEGAEKDSSRSFPITNYIYKADRNTNPSADHSKFEILKQPFENAHQLTAACLSCHTERDKEIMITSHWNWEREDVLEGKGKIKLGKTIMYFNILLRHMLIRL